MKKTVHGLLYLLWYLEESFYLFGAWIGSILGNIACLHFKIITSQMWSKNFNLEILSVTELSLQFLVPAIILKLLNGLSKNFVCVFLKIQSCTLSTYLHPRGNLPWKFELNWFSHFWLVTIKHTYRHTHTNPNAGRWCK